MKNLIFIGFLFFMTGCVENLNLGTCGRECPFNQTCINLTCGCEEGTEKLGDRCFHTVDGYYIGNLESCIGRIGFALPLDGVMKYRLDSSVEGVYQGVIKQDDVFYVSSFTTCVIKNKNAFADLYLKITDDGRMAVKLLWREFNEDLNNPLIDEFNTFFALPEKYNSPITPR